MMTTTTDHAAEYTRADGNIRDLTRAIASILSAIAGLDDMAGSGDALAYEAREDMLAGLRRCKALRERETARRDAAELAQRARAGVDVSAAPTIAERDAAVLATDAAKRAHTLLATCWGDAATPVSAEGLAAAHVHLDLTLRVGADFEHHPDIEERVARVTNRCVTTAISRGIAVTRGEVAA